MGFAMIVNPFLELMPVPDEGEIKAIRVSAPAKGDGLKVTKIDRDHDPELFAFLVIYIYSGAKGSRVADNLTDLERDRLTAIGFLVRDDQVPTRRVSFSCDFDAVHVDLLPLRARRRARPYVFNNKLIVDPSFRKLGRDEIRREMRQLKKANPFHPDRSWFSIDDGLSAPTFYSYAADANEIFDSLPIGQPVPKRLSPDVRQKLVEAGILQFQTEISARREIRMRESDAAHKSLVESRYAILRDIVHPVQLAAIRRYYRDFTHEGFVQFGDTEWPNRFFSGLDGLTYFFQRQLTPIISEIVREKVHATFAYFASYRAGSDLKKHRDRKQCYYALSVFLDHHHANDLSLWPIYLQPPGAEAVPVSLNLGDGVLYFGEEVSHYRLPLTEGHSTHWFLFWVPEGYEDPPG
jgi:hypothetical protein